MKPFDVIEDIRPGLGARAVLAPIDALPLEQAEEALRSGIVGAGSHRTHAASDLMPFQEPLVLIAGELAAAVRVKDDRLLIHSY